MNYSLNVLFGFIVGIAAIIGWVRYKKTDPAFLPFLLLLLFGFANEIVSAFLVYNGYFNSINYNLFCLLESILVTWQFQRWGLFGKRIYEFRLLLLFYILFCGTEWLNSGSTQLYNSYFIIVYSLCIVLMSMMMINRLLFTIPGNLLKEAVYLICMGFCIYFTYTVLVEVFWLYGLHQTVFFRLGIYELLSYINLFTNCLYVYATLCIPLKPRYIMR